MTLNPDPLAVPWADDHAVLLARARRAKLAQVRAFLVGLALGAAAGVVVAGVWR